jgi:transposase
MIWERFIFESIYLYRDPIDMRKGADGLAALVSEEMSLEPCSSTLFLFTNRSRNKLKILLWEKNGFWVFYKRLIKQRFAWPDWFDDESLLLSEAQVDLLLQGFNLNGMRPHKTLNLHYCC